MSYSSVYLQFQKGCQLDQTPQNFKHYTSESNINLDTRRIAKRFAPCGTYVRGVLFLVSYAAHTHFFVFPAISAPELPNLKHLPLLHMNLFSELSDPAPSFDTQQQAHPAYDWGSDRCANVFVSHPSAAHHPVAAEWRLPPSMSVSETQGIFKNHSQPFILCCWNNNVRPRFPPAQTSERICVLHLHDLPHFSIWDRRLHHLTSWKQLKGFITWLARRRHQSTAVTGGCNMKWVFYSSGGMCS